VSFMWLLVSYSELYVVIGRGIVSYCELYLVIGRGFVSYLWLLVVIVSYLWL